MSKKSKFLQKNKFNLLMFILTITIQSCDKSDSIITIEDEVVTDETVDLTHLPFGGTRILRRDRGDTHQLEALYGFVEFLQMELETLMQVKKANG